MKRIWAGTAALALGAGAVTAGLLGAQGGASAAAAPKAKVTVTIKAEQVDLSGTVSSPKPKKCAANRTVVVFEQIGGRGGGNDKKRFSDTTSLSNGKYVWSTGNTGEEGFFYAVVAAKPGCKGDSSPTVHAVRSDD
jgi:hypothetical protein